MSRLRPPIVVAAVLAVCGCTHVGEPEHRAAAASWPHERSDLKPDPEVVWGRLENGLRYAILPHATPQRRASMMLLVAAGSFHEGRGELGYAHFVEHMAFRELRGFPGTSAMAQLDRLGAGPHANANTNIFETKYFFNDLPTDDPEAFPTGLKILRAMADGIVFNAEAVEHERDVVFSEQRSHEAVLAQARPDELEFVAPRENLPRWPELSVLFEKGRIASRHPIGGEKTLRAANPARLRAFYERWYRPERMIVVIVGDVAPADVEPQLRATFSTVAAHGRPPAEPRLDPPRNPMRWQNWPNNAEPMMLLSLGVVRSHPVGDDTAARRRSLARRLALAMLERRLERIAEGADAPFVTTDVLSSHYVPARELILVRTRARPAEWPRAMNAIDFEVRRINELGFSEAELALAEKTESLRTAAAARQAVHRPSGELAAELAVSIERGIVFTSAESDRDLTGGQMAAIDAKECHAAFRDALYADEWSISLIGPMGEGTAKPERINFKESRTAQLTPYVPPAPPRSFPFTEFGPAGVVVRREHSDAGDIDLLEFANGVRLNLKRTRFEPGHVWVEIRLAGGRMACPADKPGLDWRTFAWRFGGLEGLSLDEQNSALADLNGSYTYTVGPTAFSLVSEVDATELPLLFQASTAYLVRPSFRAEAGPRALEIARQVLAPFSSTADGVARETLWNRMSAGHAAFRQTNLDETSQRTLEELKAWFAAQLASTPLEIGLVGDFDPAVAIDTCARTFGALPVRASGDPFAAARMVAFPPPPFAETISFSGPKSVAMVTLAWPTPEASAFAPRCRAQVLAAILKNRIYQRLRSEMGETYSPDASFVTDDGFTPALAFLRAAIEAAPDRVERVATAAAEVAATLAREGATPGEFERARQPLVRSAESDLRSNSAWLEPVALAQSNHGYAEAWAAALEGYRAVTLDEINADARQWLAPERMCRIVAQPK